MACGSCSQKYRGLTRARNVNAQRFTRKGVKVIPKPVIDIPQPPVTVQPDTKEAVKGSEESYPVDPSTGLNESVLKTGSCPENDIGDTTPTPVTVADIPESESKNQV